MKKVLIMLLACISFNSTAQLADPLFFREKIHDFGDVKEEDGPAMSQSEIDNLFKVTRSG